MIRVLAFLTALVSTPAFCEVPALGPGAVVRADEGEMAPVMAALRFHGFELVPGFINDFQPYLGMRRYADGVAHYAWETVGGPEKRIIVWVDDPQDREPVILLVHALFRPAGGGVLTVFRTNPSGVLLAAMRSELVPYRPAAYSGVNADLEFSMDKSFWMAWETTMRGKPRGEGRP